jgi:hypothetical protein
VCLSLFLYLPMITFVSLCCCFSCLELPAITHHSPYTLPLFLPSSLVLLLLLSLLSPTRDIRLTKIECWCSVSPHRKEGHAFRLLPLNYERRLCRCRCQHHQYNNLIHCAVPCCVVYTLLPHESSSTSHHLLQEAKKALRLCVQRPGVHSFDTIYYFCIFSQLFELYSYIPSWILPFFTFS